MKYRVQSTEFNTCWATSSHCHASEVNCSQVSLKSQSAVYNNACVSKQKIIHFIMRGVNTLGLRHFGGQLLSQLCLGKGGGGCEKGKKGVGRRGRIRGG